MISFDRQAAVDTARAVFDKPCPDRIVYTKEFGHNIDNLKAEANRPRANVKFAWYEDDDPANFREGLFAFDPGDHTDTVTTVLGANEFDTAARPDTQKPKCPRLLIAWSDLITGEPQYVQRLRPRYFGLNDRAHFVSTCLKAGNLMSSLETRVEPLLEKLKRMGGIVLAENLEPKQAKMVVTCGLLKGGDVCLFSSLSKKKPGAFELHHSALVLGEKSGATKDSMDSDVACHTRRFLGPLITNHNAATANVHHPFTTFVHFPVDDAPRDPRSFRWKVRWQNRDFLYRFDSNGSVGYRALDKSTESFDGVGYWRLIGRRIVICWSATGTIETFWSTDGETKGAWNGDAKDNGLSVSYFET